MATTSRASCKRVEDVEIFQVLEESTQIVMSQYFHLRKKKMVMNPTVMKMDNWITILKQMKMETIVLEAQKIPHLKWINTLNCKEALNLLDKFTQAYIPGCELAVDEAMIGFKGRFFLKHYLPGKPTK